MYLTTIQGLAEVQRGYGPLAGTLGESPFPFEIRKFLDRVRKSPEDYEAVLLTVSFHVEPFASDQLRKVMAESLNNDAKDPFEEAKAIQTRVIQTLEEIRNEHLKNTDFSKRFNKERQLIPVVARAFQETIRKIETQGWLEKILIDALLAESSLEVTEQVGKPLVLHQLPVEVSERVLDSRLPETHYARLGKALLLMAERRQKDNRTFRQRVEQEQKKRSAAKTKNP